jgi:hypothetical protein
MALVSEFFLWSRLIYIGDCLYNCGGKEGKDSSRYPEGLSPAVKLKINKQVTFWNNYQLKKKYGPSLKNRYIDAY